MDNDEMLVVVKQIFEQNMEKMEKKFDEKVDEVKVIVENLENKIQIVAEGHGILNRKIDALDKKVDTLDKKVDNTKHELIARIDKLEKNMEIVKDYVIGVDAKLNEHEIILKRVK